MLKILKENKAVVRFLLIFGGCYLVLALLYKAYLSYEVSEAYYPDFFTHLVAEQTKLVLRGFGYVSETLPHPNEESVQLFVNGKLMVRVVEGCNAISVIILFVSFVVAFFNGWKPTLLFIFGGAVLLYVMNIFRIALLTIGLYGFPQYKQLLHDIVFPAIIYGTVFLLWFLWMNRFSKQTTK
ncbi:MAG TPA: exosortase family protein XrtF [Flavobacteriaceae bacterium]|nr:exosortase family protein XrtF [Flavobacteriaceae bacterium]